MVVFDHFQISKMPLPLQIIVIYIKGNIITKLQKLYSSPKKSRASNKSPALFVKKPCCKGDLLPAHKIFVERPASRHFPLTF